MRPSSSEVKPRPPKLAFLIGFFYPAIGERNMTGIDWEGGLMQYWSWAFKKINWKWVLIVNPV